MKALYIALLNLFNETENDMGKQGRSYASYYVKEAVWIFFNLMLSFSVSSIIYCYRVYIWDFFISREGLKMDPENVKTILELDKYEEFNRQGNYDEMMQTTI